MKSLLDVEEAFNRKMQQAHDRAVELYGSEAVSQNDGIAADNAMYCAGSLLFKTQEVFLGCINCTDEKKAEALQSYIEASDEYVSIYAMSLQASIEDEDDLRGAEYL